MTDAKPSERVFSGTMSTRGRVTVPKALREEMRLRPGCRLVFVTRDGEVKIRLEDGEQGSE